MDVSDWFSINSGVKYHTVCRRLGNEAIGPYTIQVQGYTGALEHMNTDSTLSVDCYIHTNN